MPFVYGKDYGFFCPFCGEMVPFGSVWDAWHIYCQNADCEYFSKNLCETGHDVMSLCRMDK